MKIVELNKNSTSGINCIEQNGSLSEWAVEFIKCENITRETVKTNARFHSLARREKDAVRYQLKKHTGLPLRGGPAPLKREPVPPRPAKPASQKMSQWTLRRGLMVGLGAWIAVFLLNDIVGIYQAKGLGPWVSWQAAILVELCIFMASIGTDKRLHRLALCLVAYNALVFGCVEVAAVFSQHDTNLRSGELAESKERQIKNQQGKIEAKSLNGKKALDHVSFLISKGYVSSGSSAFEKLSTITSDSERSAEETLAKLEIELGNIKSNTKSTLIVATTSTLYFLLRCLLQFFSVWLLRSRLN